MKTILFINACMRGEAVSRTGRLARAFLEACRKRNPDLMIKERNVLDSALPVLTGALAEKRDQTFRENPHDSMFDAAWEMAGADLIVIAAPYWDLTFPAALKVYLEWCSILGITFHYTREGKQEGLCRAEKLVYITTAGGIIGNQNYGYEYIRGLGGMFGIHDSAWLSAEGLDIQENDPEEIMREAEKEAARLADMYLNGSTGVNPEQEKTWPIS